MFVATFNCNSVRQRIDIINRWLNDHQPDVLALQETKVIDEQFPAQPFIDAGWYPSYRGQKSYNGVAFMTREKPEYLSFGLQDGDQGESETRLARIRYQGIDIINTYIPQGQAFNSPKFQFKLEWFKRLTSYFQKNFDIQKDKVLWVGDLNVAPTPIDVYDHKKIWPHVVHCQEVGDALEEITKLGFVDIFRKHLPEEGIFTFFDYRSRNSVANNRGWRIDHIQASHPMAEHSQDCFVDLEPRKAEKPSDHTFVGARFH